MIEIRRALLDEAGTLSLIAVAAKRSWGYPERWMELWIQELEFAPEYF